MSETFVSTAETEVNYLSVLWAASAEPMNSHDKRICTALVESVKSSAATDMAGSYIAYGEQLFMEIIYPKCVAAGFMEFLDTKVVPSAKLTTASVKKTDAIKQKVEKQLLTKKVDGLINLLKQQAVTTDLDEIIQKYRAWYRSNSLEYRAVMFYYTSWIMVKVKRTSTLEIYGFIVGLQKFIQALESAYSKTISSTCLELLHNTHRVITRMYGFSGKRLNAEAPELTLMTPYDEFLPCASIEPYPHQQTMLTLLDDRDAMKTGFLSTVITGTGSGKTITALLLAVKIQEIRKGLPIKLLFVSALPSVRRRAAQLFHSFDIPFGFILPLSQRIKEKRKLTGTYFIDYSYTCSGDETKCVALVCSPDIAIKVFGSDSSSIHQNSIMFLDELNYGAERVDSKELAAHMQLLYNAPKWTYVASATLASGEAAKPLIAAVLREGAKHVEIHSTQIYGCSSVKNFNGAEFVPHQGCVTMNALDIARHAISSNLFLGKMYNPENVATLLEKIKKFLIWYYDDEEEDKEELDAALASLPNLDTIFSDVRNLKADKVRTLALSLLDYIKQFDDDYMIEAVAKPCKGTNSLDFETLGTKGAHMFPDPTLIACEKPLECGLQWFSPLLEAIKKRVGSFKKLEQAYADILSVWQRGYDRLEDKIKNPSLLEQAKQELLETRPILSFPDDLQINTVAHFRKYGGTCDTRPQQGARIPINVSSIDFENMAVSDDLALLLCAGVGIYINPSHKVLSSSYLKTVLALAADGKLNYIVGDASLAYGLDMPFGSVIICDDFASSHSLNTCYQLMARAGRGRLAFLGRVYMSDTCILKILESYNPVQANLDSHQKSYSLVGGANPHSAIDSELQNMMTVITTIASNQTHTKNTTHDI